MTMACGGTGTPPPVGAPPSSGGNGSTGGAPQSSSHTVSLSWTASRSPVVGYNVYRGEQSSNPTKLNSNPEPATTFRDAGVQAGLTYSYFVTAVDGNAVESPPSNRVTITVP